MSKSKAIQSTRPKTRQEFMDKLVIPYDESQGKSGGVFSEPKKQGQPEKNRAYEVSQKNDTDKNIAIGIKDITEAIMYYFDNVLKLSVVQNDTAIPVPILYGTPENWKSVQKDGYYRDKNGKLMAPLLMFRRTSVTQNRTLGNKIDGKMNQNIQIFEKPFSKRNIYNTFNALNSRELEKEYVLSITPDYVKIQYECVVWTYFVEQMDKIVEALNFESRKYWGDPLRFQFYTDIETFSDSITYEVGEDRAVKCTFNMTISGYLIPDSVNKEILSAQRAYGVSKVIFGIETATSTEQFTANTKARTTTAKTSVRTADSINNVTYQTDGVDPEIATYISTNKSVTGTIVDSTTATFAADWLTAPTGMPATSINDFIFFVNGALIERFAITSFTTNGLDTSTIVIDPNQLQFSLDSGDIIVAIGKFK